jgi:hypothetical protein
MQDNSITDRSPECTTEMITCHSELLCFMVDKAKTMPKDHIVKICLDFFKEDEILEARAVLVSCCPELRITKRQGPDKLKNTLSDIHRTLTEPDKILPVFYAVDISRLPAVDAQHCDIAALLQEISALRQEVRAAMQLREEVNHLRNLLQHGCSMGPTAKAVPDTDSIAVSGTIASTTESIITTGPSYAAIAAVNSVPVIEMNNVASKKATKTFKPTVGNSTKSSKLKGVQTSRVVDLFVTRLHPLTTEGEIVESVNEVGSAESPINIMQVECTKLESRFPDMYCSYHVAVRVDSTDLSRAIDLLMSPSIWPYGILVRRYFKPKSKTKNE